MFFGEKSVVMFAKRTDNIAQLNCCAPTGCAAEYASEMGKLIGSKFEPLIYDKMTKSVISRQFHNPKAKVKR